MKAKQITLGILAHVDAGKTTLSEAILFESGSIRRLGRVDHGDAFLDTDPLEKRRGITISSKQARFTLGDKEMTLLDTPGHVDFSAEMERTLQVLDYAVLVINGADGVQSHTRTLWNLLKHYRVPVFLFINKMDQPGADRDRLRLELKRRLDEACLDFNAQKDVKFFDELAMCDELLMEAYLEKQVIDREHIASAIAQRNVFPCYFGSALRAEGIVEFLRGLETYTAYPDYPEAFAARIYKISRDSKGARLTHMKITGGVLKVKTLLEGPGETESAWQEKADQIRLYSGERFQPETEAQAGTICAVTGLTRTRAGEGLGAETAFQSPLLEPVLTYRILLPDGCDVHKMRKNLLLLEEEEPQLHIVWNERLGEIHVQLMGEIEKEVLKSRIADRFDTDVEFDAGSIVYRETITAPVVGIGHFEPLRHYAEVHLLMEPGKRGSGLQFAANCREAALDRNWQRLILTHLAEKTHIGVLTGSEITDMKITLIAGRAHEKHTEGGDFRQATYRAVRHGLKKARCILLEPVYDFRLEVPAQSIGRAMADIQRMSGTFKPPETENETAYLNGIAPVSEMRDYQTEMLAYTKGRGKLTCVLKGYEPCHNAEQIVEEKAYDSEQDMENPTGSVFCSHGAGFTVSWDQVESHMHADSGWQAGGPSADEKIQERPHFISGTDDKELEKIFLRTYGEAKRERNRFQRPLDPAEKSDSGEKRAAKEPVKPKEKYLLVDGYNIIFAWEELKELAEVNLDSARDKLIEILRNYQGYRGDPLIVVFDAYKVKGGKGSVEQYGDVYVIYTKEAETADQYIERAVNKIGRTCDVTVATSDNMVQMIIWGEGAMRISARGLKREIEAAAEEIRDACLRPTGR